MHYFIIKCLIENRTNLTATLIHVEFLVNDEISLEQKRNGKYYSEEKMYKIINSIQWRLKTLLIKILLKRKKVKFAAPPSFSGCWPEIKNEGTFFIGANCSFNSFRLRQHFTVKKNAVLEIKDGSRFNDGVNLCATRSIKLGHHVRIGDMTYIYDTDFHQTSPETPTKCEPVIIGNNVWIGANSIVLPGSVIGDHAVIAAGSIVTGEIPAKSLAAGVPAKVVKILNIPDDWLRK